MTALILTLWLALALAVAIAARSRGRSGVGWFCVGAMLSPLVALLLLAVMPMRARRAQPGLDVLEIVRRSRR